MPKFNFKNVKVNLTGRVLEAGIDVTAKESSSTRVYENSYIKVKRCRTLIVDTKLETYNMAPGFKEAKDMKVTFQLLQNVNQETVSKECPDDKYEYDYDYNSIEFKS